MGNFPAWYWFIAFVIMSIINLVLINVETEEKELGQAICDQEYNMNFDSYDNGILKCKPKDIKAAVQYDGIIIQIKTNGG